MRTLRTAVLLLAAAAPLSAQSTRFSITPFAGWTGSSPLLDHTIHFVDGPLDYTSEERVTLGSALNLGARLGVQLSPGWTLYLQGASARSQATFRDTTTQRIASGGEATVSNWSTSDATASTATIELARRFPLAPGGAELELSLGAGVQRLLLHPIEEPCSPDAFCPVPMPSLIEDRHDVPTALAGVALRQPIARTLSAEVRSSLLLGRMDTENLRIELAGDYARYNAPAHRMIRSLQASFGLSWHP
jgi:hypothetical protein